MPIYVIKFRYLTHRYNTKHRLELHLGKETWVGHQHIVHCKRCLSKHCAPLRVTFLTIIAVRTFTPKLRCTFWIGQQHDLWRSRAFCGVDSFRQSKEISKVTTVSLAGWYSPKSGVDLRSRWTYMEIVRAGLGRRVVLSFPSTYTVPPTCGK